MGRLARGYFALLATGYGVVAGAGVLTVAQDHGSSPHWWAGAAVLVAFAAFCGLVYCASMAVDGEPPSA